MMVDGGWLWLWLWTVVVVVDGLVPCTTDSSRCSVVYSRIGPYGHLFRAVAPYRLGPGRSLTGAKVAPGRSTSHSRAPGVRAVWLFSSGVLELAWLDILIECLYISWYFDLAASSV